MNVLQMQMNYHLVFNRGDTYYSIPAVSRQGSLAKPQSLLFLTPRPVLSSHQHRTLVCLLWSGNLHFAPSPANPTLTCQECFELLDVSDNEIGKFWNRKKYLHTDWLRYVLITKITAYILITNSLYKISGILIIMEIITRITCDTWCAISKCKKQHNGRIFY